MLEMYARLRTYVASKEQLQELGVNSVIELVHKVNSLLRELGRKPITQGDYPSNKAAFNRLVKRVARLEQEVADAALESQPKRLVANAD